MNTDSIDRRTFIRRCGRLTSFAALTTLCGLLIAKRNNQNCIVLNTCDACLLFKKCQQPQALKTREPAPKKVSPS